jgi:tRNA uridine 5-carboxymethylaminomethyl modification enzyme
MEDVRIPADINYDEVYGLTREVREKLHKIRPVNLGQASRISGVTPFRHNGPSGALLRG